MTSLTMNDVNGKAIASNESVKVEIYNRSTKLRKSFDCSFEDVKKLMMCKGVVKIPWYKLEKNEDGKWERLTVDDPAQEKTD